MALNSRKKGGDDDDGDSPFMSIQDVMRKLKAGPLNFGVFQTGDKDNPVLLAAHKRKNPTILGKQAKKEAGTTKGAFGRLSLESGELSFLCENDDPPASLKKKIKVMLKAAGYAKFKARILLPGGIELGDDEDEGDEDEGFDDLDGAVAGGDDGETEDAEQKEAHHALIDRAGELENQVYDNGLDESKPGLLAMLQTARGMAHDEKFAESAAALDAAEAVIAKAIAAAKKGAEGGDPLKQEVDARWQETRPILETLIDTGDGKVAAQGAKLLKLMQVTLDSGDYKKARGAMVVVEKFVEGALAGVGREGGGATAGSGGSPAPAAPGIAAVPGGGGGGKPAAPGAAGGGGAPSVDNKAAPAKSGTPKQGYANGAPPVTAEENERLAALSPQELAKTDLTIGDTKALFGKDYMMALKDAPIRGAGDPKLKDLMREIEQGLSGPRRLEVMQSLAQIVGIPPTAEKLDLDYGRFLVVRKQQQAKGKEEVPALATDVHKEFRGSRSQLMFGKVLGDAFGIHEVFAALLSPTGGLVGPGNKLLGPIDALHLAPDNPVALHGTVHDAAGYLLTYHDEGPGYNYLDSDIELLGPGDPLSGQVSGIAYWVKEVGADYVEKRVDAAVVEVEKKLKSARDAVEAEIDQKIAEAKKKADQGIALAKKAADAAEKLAVDVGNSIKDAAGKVEKAGVEAFEAGSKKVGKMRDEAKRTLDAAWDFIWN